MDTISQEQRKDNFREILAWLRGGDVTPNPEMEEKFIDTITGMVIDRMNPPQKSSAVLVIPKVTSDSEKESQKVRPNPLSLKAMMREITGDDNCEFPKNLIRESNVRIQSSQIELQQKKETLEKTSGGIDSVILARTLVHLSKLNAHQINISQIQIILYIAYGIYLVRHEKRLTDEHPQMWEYGPVFPRAYNRLRKNPSDGKEEAQALKDSDCEVYNLMEYCFRRYAWTSATVLSAPHTASGSPWAMTRKNNPDRWGVQIVDEMIAEWFTKRMNKG